MLARACAQHQEFPHIAAATPLLGTPTPPVAPPAPLLGMPAPPYPPDDAAQPTGALIGARSGHERRPEVLEPGDCLARG
ncbi:hypothetical protein, partial [Brachybacterium phenoliresistens]|uniref:hypothetical protein n=1 Tax=Brachybacterium phenoliresistens TaxID=396014 RepID=UPI0031E1AFC5